MNLYRDALINNPLVPWRVRSRVERWTETRCRLRHPRLYRLLHLGSMTDRVRPLTRGPAHHFFGYYEKSPWNASQTLVLAHEASFNDRPPSGGDTVRVGIVPAGGGPDFRPLAETGTWNWQQGAMLQWHPARPDEWIIFNAARGDRATATIIDTEGREEATLERPIYAMAPDGRYAVSLNFARLHRFRPGYGYPGLVDPWCDERAPGDDGLWLMDLVGDASRLLVSLHDLARRSPRSDMAGAFHWLNHAQVSPGGRRIAFFHIWGPSAEQWSVRLYVADPGTGACELVLDTGDVSHYDWLDDDRLLVWARHPDGDHAFLLCDVRDGGIERVGEGVLTEDGHCSYSPDRRWVLNDTYPDVHGMRTLMLFDAARGRRIDIARLHSPKERWWGEIRCDLHPRWSRDGRKVCIDSVHSAERQMYEVDLAGLV